jgi:WD40-like Beta Propeller Repeat
MKKRIFILWINIMIFLGGCSGTLLTQGTLPSDELTLTPLIIPTKTIVQIGTSPTTPVVATKTVNITSTITPTPDTGVSEDCLTIQPNLPGEIGYSGKIMLETHGPDVVNNISYYYLNSGNKSDIPSMGSIDLSVSPNRTRFAFEDYNSKRLKVFGSDGIQIKSLPWGKYWGWVDRWLDNQNIAIVMAEPESSGSNFDKYPRAVLILNPFTNQMQTLPPDFPDIDLASTNLSWDKSGTTIYDPTLRRVVYPGTMQGGNLSGMGYILYGIPEKKKLAQIPSAGWDSLPLWSPDGSKFIVMGDDEFYQVSYDGRISKITHMNPGYVPDKNSGDKYWAEYYSWSPDGQHLALWLQTLDTHRRTLAILDVATGLITDACISAGYNPDDVRTLPYPVWSPDGRSLVVAANYRPEDNGNDVVLVDLEKDEAYKLTTNKFPVGWLVTP